jgi:hypothetical protein
MTLASSAEGDGKVGDDDSAGQLRQGVEAGAPEVLGDLLAYPLDIGKQFNLVGSAALQGLIKQHALTEAMDGIDFGTINLGQGQLHQGESSTAIGHGGDPGAQGGVSALPQAVCGEKVSRRHQQGANPSPQLFGGRLVKVTMRMLGSGTAISTTARSTSMVMA